MAYSEELWKEAKKKCRLNNDDIALAKRLGLNPKSLIKNIPNKSEPWKTSVKIWIHDIADKREIKNRQRQERKAGMAVHQKRAPVQAVGTTPTPENIDDSRSSEKI